jgi:hypothetical protein
MTDRTQARSIDPTELPRIITSYTGDSTVADDGNTYAGLDEIRAWLSRSASEYTYTIEVTGAQKLDDRPDFRVSNCRIG